MFVNGHKLERRATSEFTVEDTPFLDQLVVAQFHNRTTRLYVYESRQDNLQLFVLLEGGKGTFKPQQTRA